MGERLRAGIGRGTCAWSAAIALALTGAALGVGCGGASHHGRTTTTPAAATPAATQTQAQTQTTPTFAQPSAVVGKERAVFRANCGACHTLHDAGTSGRRAGGESELDVIHPNSSSVAWFAFHGFGKMPSFRRKLTRSEIAALARYVADADGCGSASPTSCEPVN